MSAGKSRRRYLFPRLRSASMQVGVIPFLANVGGLVLAGSIACLTIAEVLR